MRTRPPPAVERYLPGGIGWYRKTFQIPDSFKGRQISIEFDGVYENSDVWINGHWLGKRPFGYISFHYDLTPFLNFNQQPNLLGRPGGQFRPAEFPLVQRLGNLSPYLAESDRPLEHRTVGRLRDHTAGESKPARRFNWPPRSRTNRNAPARFRLISTLIDRDGREVGTDRSEGELDAGETGKTHPTNSAQESQSLVGPVARISTPFAATLRIGDETIDQCDTPIGIRSIEFDTDKGFLLNGKPVKLNGVCLHCDGGSVGSAVPEGVWLRRLRLLKQMGCNAIRTSHNPPAPEFLDLCDQLGFLVMDEAFDEWTAGKTVGGYHRFFNDWSQRDLVDFIHRDRNHPSVVLWSAGNEIQEQILPGGADVLRPLVETFHREDPTRPVTAACDKVFAEPLSAPPEFAALLDVVGYNYVDRWLDRTDKYYSVDRQLFPQRKFIGTESVSMGGIRGDYRESFYNPATAAEPIVPPPDATQPAAAFTSGNAAAIPPASCFQPPHRCRATLEIRPNQRLRLRRFHVDRNRLPRRSVLAGRSASVRRTRHLRIPQGRILFLSEPMDERSRSSSVSTLELARPRRADHSRHVLHELRYRRADRQRQIVRNQGL